jgi:hypothetical protein
VAAVNTKDNSQELNTSGTVGEFFVYDYKDILKLETFRTSDITFVLNNLSLGTMGNLNTYGAYLRFYAYTNCSSQNSSKIKVQTKVIFENIKSYQKQLVEG